MAAGAPSATPLPDTAPENPAQPDTSPADWFADVYRSTFEPVYRYALALVRDRDRADDLTSEAYLRAWRARDRFNLECPPLRWLLVIVHNLAISQLRSTREMADMSVLFQQEDREPGPEMRLLAAHESRRVGRAIAQLTLDQQQVIVLRFALGLSHEEIGARLGRSANAMRATQFRALGRLRTLLERNDAVVA